VLPVEPMVKEGSIRVKLVKYSISIALMARCEDDDFPVFLHLFEEGYCVGTNIEANLKGKAINIDGKLDIWLTLILLKAMNKCLIEV
jgi:hypothetical protein